VASDASAVNGLNLIIVESAANKFFVGPGQEGGVFVYSIRPR